jgi:hypothetical protein
VSYLGKELDHGRTGQYRERHSHHSMIYLQFVKLITAYTGWGWGGGGGGLLPETVESGAASFELVPWLDASGRSRRIQRVRI